MTNQSLGQIIKMMGFWVTGGLWVATHKPRGRWVRVGLKMRIFLVAHGASHGIEAPPIKIWFYSLYILPPMSLHGPIFAN